MREIVNHSRLGSSFQATNESHLHSNAPDKNLSVERNRDIMQGSPFLFQTASGVSSKVMDDYCWIHSTFHIRNEFQVRNRETGRGQSFGYHFSLSCCFRATLVASSTPHWPPTRLPPITLLPPTPRTRLSINGSLSPSSSK